MEDTGLGSHFFQSVAKDGKRSPYWDWYIIKKWLFVPGNASAYQAWQGVGSLPLLRTTNPQVLKYLLGVAKYWIKFGFSGIRVDSPQTLVDEAQVMKDLGGVMKSVNPEAYLVGEDWSFAPDWVGPGRFDSLMNYAIGRDVILQYVRWRFSFMRGHWALVQLSKIYAAYPVATAAMGFNNISTHDTSRLLTGLGGRGLSGKPAAVVMKRQRLAAALLYALPGVPVTFQGDECAFLGSRENYDAQRYPLQWSRCDQAMLLFYHRLGRLKDDLAPLHSSVWAGLRG